MKKLPLTLASASLFALTTLIAPAWAEQPHKAPPAHASINPAQLELMVKSFVAQGATDNEALRQKLSEELRVREAVAQEATKAGLDKSPEFVAALVNAKRDLLVAAFQSDYAARHPISDADIKTLYEQQKAEAGNKEYRVRHVLVKTETEARSIIAALNAGEKFDAIAREKSLDAASRAVGGDIGWQVPAMLVAPVRDVVRSLSKGQTSEQVQSPFGWHVLRVEDVRPYEFPAFEKAKPVLQQQLQQQAILRAIEAIKNKTVPQ